ncbi:MAG: hypothetical protein N2444_08530 [Methylocystis sp.]|nr:hypothetical protein [Methylocystis sp.]
MMDLLTLGWPWFAATIALGAIIGFFATSGETNAPSAPGWVFLALVAALAIGALLSAGGMFEGRDAVSFDIGLLAFGGYTIGLPFGRMLKLAGAPSAGAPKRAAPQLTRPIITHVATPAPAKPEPAASDSIAAPSPAVAARAPEPEIEAAAKAARELSEKVAKLREPASRKGSAKGNGKAAEKPGVKSDKAASAYPGVRPATLAAARGGAPDDLSRIKGVGPKSVEKLHKLGVFHYDQIAGWSADNAKWIGAAIGAAAGGLLGAATAPQPGYGGGPGGCARWGWDYYGNRVCTAYY